jgi:hypothetical protein
MSNARNRMTRVGNSRTTPRGVRKRNGARSTIEHMVKHVHDLEKRRRSGVEPSWEGPFDT